MPWRETTLCYIGAAPDWCKERVLQDSSEASRNQSAEVAQSAKLQHGMSVRSLAVQDGDFGASEHARRATMPQSVYCICGFPPSGRFPHTSESAL